MAHPVWIDTDCGFDDMTAIAMVAGDPNWAIVGLGIGAGNVPLDIAVGNIARMKSFFQWTMPVCAGRAAPIVGPLVTAQHILGPDGMPTISRRLPDADIELGPVDAIQGLITAAEEAGGKLSILALGPLTNIAVTLLVRPDLAAKIHEIVWMGGSASGGNHTAAAEFNAFVDPEAVQIVLDSKVTLRTVGLDCCRQVTVNATDAIKLRGLETERARILADLLEGYVRIANPEGNRPMALYDAVAAAALLDNRAVAFMPAHMTVERGGTLTRGMTVCEFRANKADPNVMIARSALSTRVIDRMMAVFTNAAISEAGSRG